MKALVLEKLKKLSIRDIDVYEELGPDDVKIKIKNVGICGSDVHYYQYGAIGKFVMCSPMILGHEASGTIVEAGKNVTNLKPGDRVCMEPGIPDIHSKAYRLGIYNLDPSVRFWATPSVYGCMRPYVVHPAEFTYKLPDTISYEEGAMVEPLAVGMHAAKKAKIKPGDIAVVIGAGTVGIMTAVSALAAGCSKVIISDIIQPKLDIVKNFGSIFPVNIKKENMQDIVKRQTDNWGADIVFEASGSRNVMSSTFDLVCPGGCVVLIGMSGVPEQVEFTAAQAKEVRIETVFRYANIYSRALSLMGSGKINLKPLVTKIFHFEDSIEAFNWVLENPDSIKTQIMFED